MIPTCNRPECHTSAGCAHRGPNGELCITCPVEAQATMDKLSDVHCGRCGNALARVKAGKYTPVLFCLDCDASPAKLLASIQERGHYNEMEWLRSRARTAEQEVRRLRQALLEIATASEPEDDHLPHWKTAVQISASLAERALNAPTVLSEPIKP